VKSDDGHIVAVRHGEGLLQGKNRVMTSP
jgi:hypothetical protein